MKYQPHHYEIEFDLVCGYVHLVRVCTLTRTVVAITENKRAHYGPGAFVMIADDNGATVYFDSKVDGSSKFIMRHDEK
jgi:hypothetical protein